jgi:hypothetical protein
MFVAQVLRRPENGRRGVIHTDCDCRTDVTSLGVYETFQEALKRLKQLGIDRPELCEVSFPHGRPVYHLVTGVLVGHVAGNKFTPES